MSLDKMRLSSDFAVHQVLSIVQTSDIGCRTVGTPPVGKESTKRALPQYVYQEVQAHVLTKANAEI
jgi:hypothetical protein